MKQSRSSRFFLEHVKNCLGRIDGRSASDRNDHIAIIFFERLDPIPNASYRGMRSDLVERCAVCIRLL